MCMFIRRYITLINLPLYVKLLLVCLEAIETAVDLLKIPEDEEDISIPTFNEYDADNEDWLKEAILDVAYYIRSHKFNNYDRRYMNESSKIFNLYESFPKPLKALQWEVNKFCVKGFISCLKYLHTTVKKSELQRKQDTKTIMEQYKWRLPENASVISVVDFECQRLLHADYINPAPFETPIERFQWTITASYFMCWYTMQEHPSLSLFEERCDNMANCLDKLKPTDFRTDPRSNNDFPYQCSLYSFCPDICCPLRKVLNSTECVNSPFNPCNQDYIRNISCSLQRSKNTDFASVILNKWNYTCECNDKNLQKWSSAFGMCLYKNECEEQNNRCDNITQDCVNKKGGYYCVCKPEFVWDPFKNLCYPIQTLDEAIIRLAAPKKKLISIWQTDKGFSVIKGIMRYLNLTDEDNEDDII